MNKSLNVNFESLLHNLQRGFLNNNSKTQALHIKCCVRVDNYSQGHEFNYGDDVEWQNEFEVCYYDILIWQPTNYKKCFVIKSNEYWNDFKYSKELPDWQIMGDHDSCWADGVSQDIRKCAYEMEENLKKSDDDEISYHFSIDNIELVELLGVQHYNRHERNFTKIRTNKNQPEFDLNLIY